MLKKISRRTIIKLGLLFSFILAKSNSVFALKSDNPVNPFHTSEGIKKKPLNLGIDSDGFSRIYLAKGMTPEKNIKRALDLFGGIENHIDIEDIVIIKPNAQWWHQGTTNTNTLKGLIDLILNINNFKGEIIVAENHHYKDLDSRGWVTTDRNGDYNLNELIEHYKKIGNKNVTKYHWVDGGPNPQPRQGNAGMAGVVSLEDNKDGYVWWRDSIYVSPENRSCIMTYPIFTSAFSGRRISLKDGVVGGGPKSPVRFINFSCLNHHSRNWGVTASIKNLMGVVDMTCGYQGTEPAGFYNTHYIGTESKMMNWGKQITYLGRKFGFGQKIGHKVQEFGTFNCQYTGGVLGHWMREVRFPDLNILAAEYVGWGGRIDPDKKAHTNLVALSTDPVALDYVGAKEILFRNTPVEEAYFRKLNDPDNPPFNLFLKECFAQGVGTLDLKMIKKVT